MTDRAKRRAAARKASKRAGKSALTPTEALKSEDAISEAQLNANRANAQFSTGPVTEAGKSVSARNNFRHGLTQSDGELVLLETESKDEYLTSLAAFRAEWNPATATENDLVNRMVCHQWLRRRALKLQSGFVSPTDGLITDIDNFSLYHRYEVVHDRAYNKALSDLIRLRSLRLREANGFESQRRKNEEHDHRMQAFKHRESLQQFAIATAEAKLALIQRKLEAVKPANSAPQPDEALAN
jgi:hypothetical protein